MSCRKWIGSVCSITGGRTGGHWLRAGVGCGRALANLRWILSGSGKVCTLDQVGSGQVWDNMSFLHYGMPGSQFGPRIGVPSESLGVYWRPLGSLVVPWRSRGCPWGSLGLSLGSRSGPLGSLGGPLASLVQSLGSLGGPLGVPWGLLGMPWVSLAVPCRVLGCIFGAWIDLG